MIEQQKEIKCNDYDNFLSPTVLKHFKDVNFKFSISLIKDLEKRKIW